MSRVSGVRINVTKSAKEGQSTEACPVFKRLKHLDIFMFPPWMGPSSIAELSYW